MVEEFKALAGPMGIRHLAVDSLSGLETLVHRAACNLEHVANMEAKEFKKVWAAAVPVWQRVQQALDSVRDIGVHIWLIAHSQETMEAIDTGETFAKYDLSFSGSGKSLMEIRQFWRAWPDCVFFIDWKTSYKKGSIGKQATAAYTSRIIHTKETARLFAKSRMPLPDTLPATWRDLERAMKSGMAASDDKTLVKIHAVLAQITDAGLSEEIQADIAASRSSNGLAQILSRANGILSIQRDEEESGDFAPAAEAETVDQEPVPSRHEPKAVAHEPVPRSEPVACVLARPITAPADQALTDAFGKITNAFPHAEGEALGILGDDMTLPEAKMTLLRSLYSREATSARQAPVQEQVQEQVQATVHGPHETKLVIKIAALQKASARTSARAEVASLIAEYGDIDALSFADLDALHSQIEGALNGARS